MGGSIMAIKIETKQTVIPVEIGELEFEFDLGDKNMKKVEKKAKEMEQAFKKFENLEDEENFTDEENEKNEAEAQELIRGSFDYLLGEGAFDKIYEQTPNISFLGDYFLQLVEGIDNEIKTRSRDAKKTQYLNKKAR